MQNLKYIPDFDLDDKKDTYLGRFLLKYNIAKDIETFNTDPVKYEKKILDYLAIIPKIYLKIVEKIMLKVLN
ncbi:MAG: hypothetical protein ACLU2L_03655 [Fenollaria timonensis]